MMNTHLLNNIAQIEARYFDIGYLSQCVHCKTDL